MRFNHGRHYGRKGVAHEEKFLRYRHGGSHGGFGGRGEGKRRFFERGEFKFALLELLALVPMHGYQLIKAMEEKTGGLYTPSAGSIYPNLQLLEDMKLILGFIDEADGKKLYRITDEGLAALRERESEENKQPEDHWERPGRHRHSGGGHRRRDLRGFMKEWSEVIYIMARAAEAVQENPASKHAAQFQEIMTNFQNDLKQFLVSVPNPSMDDKAAQRTETDSLTDDNQEDKL
ncbi:PadR family transcriptional regulator [Paenibacillus sp. FSL H7-0331]|uniref:PadR family transcriptional regulator n=1 Tax=Paenibacillus sp. FSL H7-0331 TaxID=1920421 RepID=UPI00096E42D4|nr:PadR family transcriptional regulator [Paenibacillus sp. FSL H7-0331]OMF03895.1 PadR family transcriptional regulator [Paenibacillus sp. FSL H7-0331]